VTHGGRPATTRSTKALLRSLAIAAAACCLIAAPAAAYVLQPHTAVTVKITTHPAAATAATSARLAWKTTGAGAKTTCKLDAGAYAACSKSHAYAGLRNGLHTFTVRAKSGSTTRTASYTWRVDTVAPTAVAVSGGTGAWTAAAVTLSASAASDTGGSGVASYQHRSSTDSGGTWTTAASGTTDKVTADGTTWVQFRAVDKAGNVSVWAPATPDPAAQAMVDTTGPSVPALTGGSSAWQNVASVTVQTTGTPTDAGSGFAGYEYQTSTDGGQTWSAPAAGTSTTISAEGAAIVEFRSLDMLGNASAWTAADVAIDRTVPSAPAVTGGSSAWQAGPSVNVSAAGSTDAGSGVTGYEFETSTNGGGTWSAPTPGASAAVSAQGTTLVRFAAVDGVGLASAWSQATVNLDLTAPSAPTVSGGSSAWVNAASTTVSASGSTDSGGSALAGYQYRTSTDGGTSWSAVTGGASDAVTAEANTWVQFRSIDGAGNTSAWTPATQTAAATVKLDRTAPSAPVVSGGPAGWTNAASVILGATSTDAGSGVKNYTYETSTNGGSTWSAPTTTTNPTVTISNAGTTLVQFEATDNVNVTSAWSQVSVQIDRTAPTAPTVSGGSASWQLAAPVTLTASGSTDSGGAGLAGYQYRTSTDGGSTWSPASATGAAAAISGDGVTLVQMRAVDAAGNTSTWAPGSNGNANTVKLDTTPPTAPVVAGGTGGWSAAASVLVSASGSTDSPGSGLAGYQYQTSTDGGSTWSAVTGGASVSVSAEGATLVRFQAIDVAGRTSIWSQTSVQLDRTAPSPPAVGGGSLAWANAASKTISAGGSTDAGSGLSGYRYRTSTDGGGSWSAVPVSGSSLQVPAEGETLVQFQSVDAAGNASAWTPAPGAAGATVRLDRTAPSVPVPAGGSNAWQNAASLPITAAGSSADAASGVASYQYRTSSNGTTWSAAVSGSSFTVTAQGTTYVEFRATDGVGLQSAWSPKQDAATARLDQTDPTVPTITGGKAKYQNVASVTLTAAGSTDTGGSGLAGYQYREQFDFGPWGSATDGSQDTISAEGLTIVQFRSVDNAGNASAWEPQAAYPGNIVEIDRTPPSDPTVSGGSLSWSAAASATVSASGSSDGLSAFTAGLSGYQYRTSTNGGAWSAASPGASVAITAQGTTAVQFRGIDAAGNVSNWAPASPNATDTVMLDRTAPTLPALTGVPGGCVAGPVTVTASGSSDTLSGLDHYESTLNAGSITPGPSVVVSARGTATVKFRAVDALGNASAWVTASVCIS
jgi:large repetitive protein